MADFYIDELGNVRTSGLPVLRVPPGVPATTQPTIQPTSKPFSSIRPTIQSFGKKPLSAAGVAGGIGAATAQAAKTAAPSVLGKVGNLAKGVSVPTLALTAAGLMAEKVPEDAPKVDQSFNIAPSPMQIMGRLAEIGHETGVKLKEPIGTPESIPAMDLVRGIAGEALEFPAEIGQGMKEIGGAVSEAVGDFFTPRGEVQQREAREQEVEQARQVFSRMNDPATRETMKQNAIMGAQYDRLLAEQTQASDSVFEMGEVFLPQNMGNLPMPPRGADYTELYEMLQKTMPSPPEPQDYEGNQALAVLAGIASGILGSSDRPFGERLLAAGLGAMQGKASIAEQKKQAEEDFKKQMANYYLRTAAVKRSELEGEADYSHRVWQNKINQVKLDTQQANHRLNAMQSKMINTADGLYIQEVRPNTDGTATRVMRKHDISGTTRRVAELSKEIGRLTGDRKKADTIALNLLQAKDPNRAMGMYALTKAKASGKYESLITQIDTLTDGGFKKSLAQTGLTFSTLPGGDESKKDEYIDNERDAMLVDILTKSPAIMEQIAPSLELSTQAALAQAGRNPFQIRLRN